MNLATIAMIVVATCGVLIVSMAGLIKSMVLGKLDQIQDQLFHMGGRLDSIDGRVIRLEEWRENTNGGHAFGRRKADACSYSECPHEIDR